MVRSHARLRITLTARQTGPFTRAGVALTNAADGCIAHTPWKERKQIKEKAGTGEKQNRMSRKGSKVGGKNNSQASNHFV